ncbi:unnamed protein product, partial [Rotaria magnacalcarata]
MLMFAHTKKLAAIYMPTIDVSVIKAYTDFRIRRWTIGFLFFTIICIFLFNFVPHVRAYYLTSFSPNDLPLPQAFRCSHKNRTRLDYGRQHLAASRVIICAMIRDRETQVPRIRRQIEEITRLFADYVIVIVENDSRDRTRQELISWAQDKKVAGRIHVIGCGHVVNDDRPCNLSMAPTAPNHRPDMSRIEKMVLLRNIYMEYIEHNSQLANFDYVIVQDFDLRTYTYTDGLLSTGFHFGNDPTIDAICANGIYHDIVFGSKKYFDPYAHKDEQNEKWSTLYNDLWSAFFRYYPCDSNLVRVKSCFSGRTMYRYKSIKEKRYRTYPDAFQQAVCEHVGFHEALSIYLNSEMIFYIREN